MQVEEPRRLVVDLRLERCDRRAAENDDHAERREREEKGERRGRGEGRRELRQRHLAQPLPRPRAEHRGGRLGRPAEPRPVAADDPHDDGDVEERVGEEDRPDALVEPVREQRDERGRDDERRQHERDEDEREHELATSERKAADDPREW